MNFYRLLPWLIFIWILFSTYWYACEIKYNDCSCFRKRPDIPAFVLTDGIDTLAITRQNITFKQNNAQPYFSPDLEKKIMGIANYLANHKNKRLEITTAYAPNETPELANDRFLNTKKYLSNRMNNAFLKDAQNTFVFDSLFVKKIVPQTSPIAFQDTLFNVAELKIIPKTILSDNEIAEILNDTLRLEFDKETVNMAFSKETYQYVKNVEVLLTQQPKLRIFITGHTDDDDDAEKNYHLGMERAIMAQKWLEKMDINPRQILVFSEGETRPIASNKTLEGQRRNRRVEVVVK